MGQELGEEERIGDANEDEPRRGEGERDEEERDEGGDHSGGGQAGPEEGEGAVLRGHVQLERDLSVVLSHPREAEAPVRHEPSKPKDRTGKSYSGQTKGGADRGDDRGEGEVEQEHRLGGQLQLEQEHGGAREGG